ncbi:MAG: glycoside hydrolase family 127 protein [Acidobacteria bacterium]|nr:MAG: glycoside hydrolase family 127 protein [Acidobacteriota bacterium]
MSSKQGFSRRQFVSSAISTAAASCLPIGRDLFTDLATPNSGTREIAQDSPVVLTTTPSWRDQGILNLTKSPYAKLRNVPAHAVMIENGFWAQRREVNVNKSIPSMGKLLEANGRMDNFRRLIGKSPAAQRGPVYSDSDVYKWMEAAGFVLQSGERPELRTAVDKIAKDVVGAQQPNGYLNTYFVREHAAERMEPKTQEWGHELYNMGHFLQGATAYYRATGDRTLLNAGIRFVNDFLLSDFGPGPDKKPLYSGHPEMELALVELYRMTGDRRHLDLAGYLLAGDSRIHVKRPWDDVYHFCGTPFTSRTHLEGHAVRAMYACCGAADYYLETGDPAYWKTLDVLWKDLVTSQMYVTGGVGARSDGEAFGDPFELPNARAYGESCAAIGNMMWNWRMLAATGEAKFADVIERALYNGINSGMSLDGTLYCYRNPLAFDPSHGDKIRNDWYDTTCCPPNLERTLASLPGYFYSTSGDGIYLHLFDNSELDWHLESGGGLKVRQRTNYPWDGSVEIVLTPAEPTEFTFFLRIPGWTDSAQVGVNGKAVTGATSGQYLPIRRRWSAGDVIRVQFNMTPQLLEANAQIAENNGRVAVQRGPLVYCLEQIDQPEGVALKDVALSLGPKSGAQFQEEFQKELLGGIIVLRHAGADYGEAAEHGLLYFRYSNEARKSKPLSLTFIPYYAWANRTATPMQVWTPISKT